MHRVWITLLAGLLPGFVWASDLPALTPEAISQIEEEESRLWIESRDADKALLLSGRIIRDDEINGYLQWVMNRIFPEWSSVIQVRAIDDPTLNAFALPNGSIYLHTGLLGRLRNEAELATVLAHEGAHFIRRHGYQHRGYVKGASAFAVGIGMIHPIAAILGSLTAASSMYGYSRDLEREADEIGFKRMQAAGYDPNESVHVFKHLAQEAKAHDTPEPFLFSSHPKLEERIESYSKLLREGSYSGAKEETRFETMLGRLRVTALEGALSMNRYKSVLALLEDESTWGRYPKHVPFYLGEAYRLRGDKEDIGRAIASYEKALSRAPSHVASYRQLGLMLWKEGRSHEAKQHFRRYLELEKDASARAYVQVYLEQLTGDKHP